MKTHKLDERPIVFCLYEIDGKPSQFLSFTPKTLTNYEGHNWWSNYVLLEIRLHVGNSEWLSGDYFTIGSLRDFQQALKSIQLSTDQPKPLLSVQHVFRLDVDWCAETSDVHFIGRISGFDFTEEHRGNLHKRDHILTSTSFEFVMTAKQMISPVRELKALLDEINAHRTPWDG